MMVLIKRYSNRKLYNTQSKRYVTLDDLRQLVKEGVEIQVKDNSTGDDITVNVLIQIILTSENNNGEVMPRSFLSKLIQSGSNPFISFHAALLSYLQTYGFLLNLPTRQDILALSEKIEQLEGQINQSISKTGIE